MSPNKQPTKFYIELIRFSKETGEIEIRPIAKKVLGWPEHPDKPTNKKSKNID